MTVKPRQPAPPLEVKLLPEFSEPGLFLVRPNGTLFYAARSSAPWGRPPFDQMLRGIDIATERKMPARGEA